jgi:hypothetical protein
MKEHFYYQGYLVENKFWADTLDYFNDTNILKKMAERANIDPIVYDYLGMHMAFNLAVHFLTLREIYPLSMDEFKGLSRHDWNNIERIMNTYQFGIFDRQMINMYMTRAFKFLFRHLDAKVDHILNRGKNKTLNDIDDDNIIKYELYS